MSTGDSSKLVPVRRASKTLVAALVMFLLAVGIGACGGSNDDSPTSDSAETGGQGQSASAAGGAEQDRGKGGKEGGEGRSGGTGSEGDEAADFTPKQHSDSGGGSAQFEVKGADNSVQEYGAEADSREFEAVAAVLHDFLDARAEGNWAVACQFISKAIIRSFEALHAGGKQAGAGGCAGTLEKLINPVAKDLMRAEAAQADVGSVRVEGERSFVIYTGVESAVLAMPMTNEHGSWKVSSLTGTPLG
jgi:hypothetical protein